MTNIARLYASSGNNPSSLQAAAEYIAAGVRVMPTKANTKVPLLEGWQQQATLAPQELPRFWPEGSKHGIALVLGRWGNEDTTLVCIDLDCKPGLPNGVEAMAYLVAQHGNERGAPWVQLTPSGGVHLIYQMEGTHGNSTGNLPKGIDVRGQGGYIITAPTQNGSGQQYQWQEGNSPGDHEPGFMPTWLLDMLQPVQKGLPPVAPHKPVAADSPGEMYNSVTDWGSLLSGYGWRYLFTRRDTQGRAVQHWERPGQTEKDKTGATVCEQSGRWGVLYIWSPNVPPQLLHPAFTQNTNGYQAALSGPFALYAAMEHSGDFSAAASQLSRERGQRETDRLGDFITSSEPLHAADSAAQTGVKDDSPPPGYSVRFTNLADFTGNLDQCKPEILTDIAGSSYLYKGYEHMAWGASGCGKSWLAQYTALQEIRKGNRVLIVDYEMNQRDWVIRLRQLGATDKELRLVEYIQPQEPLRATRKVDGAPQEDYTTAGLVLSDEIKYAVGRGPVSLVVIDGVTEMLSSNMLGSNDGEDIAKMWNALPRLLTRETSAAVFAIDHINKNSVTTKQQDAMPLGSQHKLSRITGAGYCTWASSPLVALTHGGTTGLLHLYCKKDRHGGVGLGANRATLELQPLPGGKVSARLLPFDAERANAATSASDKTLATLLGLVHELDQARNGGTLDKNFRSSGNALAKQMTDKGYKMAKDKCNSLLAQLAERDEVSNMGSDRNGHWVPKSSDLFTD